MIVLLVLIFRSLSLAITTVLPAILLAIAGPLVAEAAKHGLQVSPIAQLPLIVLVIGAGIDYGLFLVFRLREELRGGQHDTAARTSPVRIRGRSNAPTWRTRGSLPETRSCGP